MLWCCLGELEDDDAPIQECSLVGVPAVKTDAAVSTWGPSDYIEPAMDARGVVIEEVIDDDNRSGSDQDSSVEWNDDDEEKGE